MSSCPIEAFDPRGPCGARVLKRSDLERIVESSRQAAEARERAQLQARHHAEDLQREREEARRQGFEAGLAQGREHAAVQALAKQHASRRRWADSQPQLVDVVMNCLRALVASLPDEARFSALAGQLLGQVAREQRARIVIAPQDLEAVRQWMQQRARVAEFDPHIEIVPDPLLAPGDCIVESDAGAIDGRLSTRLATIEAALREAQAAEGDL